MEERQRNCGGSRRGKDNGNLVVLTDERQWKCGGGGRKKTMEIWWF